MFQSSKVSTTGSFETNIRSNKCNRIRSRRAHSLPSSSSLKASRPRPKFRPTSKIVPHTVHRRKVSFFWRCVSFMFNPCVYVIICVVFLLLPHIRLLDHYQEKHQGEASSLEEFAVTHLNPKGRPVGQDPMIVVGLPKIEANLIHRYFSCNNKKSSFEFCQELGDKTHRRPCGVTILDNLRNGRDPFHGAGNYDIFSNVGVENIYGDPKDTCYFPQIEALDEIHKQFPNAVFILNHRNSAENWLTSIVNNRLLIEQLRVCNISGFPPTGRDHLKAEIKAFYNSHIKRIEEFVEKHPSHKLLKINMDSPDLRSLVVKAFGGNGKCWGSSNNASHLRASAANSVAMNNPLRKATKGKKLDLPILVMGLPKSGTTSINEFFVCNGYKTSHQFCGGKGGSRNIAFCGSIIKSNVEHGYPALFQTGYYDVYTQLDVEMKIGSVEESSGECYFPQVEALDEIHAEFPKATFILNTRDISKWYKSVSGHGRMVERLALCDMPGFPPSNEVKEEDFIKLYESQITRIKSFVKNHPSHKLIEIKIDEDDSGRVMVDNFGGDMSCWKQTNTREDVLNHYVELQENRRSKNRMRLFGDEEMDLSQMNITSIEDLLNFLRSRQESETELPLTPEKQENQKLNKEVTASLENLSDINAASNIEDEKRSMLKLPILALGLPRSGTTSLHDFFSCVGLKSSHTFCSGHGGDRKLPTCAQIIKSNIKMGLPAFHETGEYDVYAKLDLEYMRGTIEDPHGLCYFPQVEALHEIHTQYPHATIILNTRNIFKWVVSVRSHGDLADRLAQCNILGYQPKESSTAEDLILFYKAQEERVREFVRQNPSHRLVEVEIDSKDAGKTLVQEFGGDVSCWKQSNAREILSEETNRWNFSS